MSVSVHNDNSNYVFFENRNGFHVAPLSSFLTTSSSFSYSYINKGDDIKSPSAFFEIENFKFIKHTDTLDSVTRGTFSSQLHTVDLISRDIKSNDYTYHNEFNKIDHLNDNPLYKNISEVGDPKKGNQYFDYVDNGTVTNNEKNEYVKSFDPNMITIESSKTRLRSIIQTSMMDAYVCRITIPGNISLLPSTIINVSFPSRIDGEVDPLLSGNALITSVNHLITGGGSYKQTIETLMDSHI